MCNSYTVIRSCILACLLGGLSAMIIAPRDKFNLLNSSFTVTRIIYLIIISIALVLSTLIFILQVARVLNYKKNILSIISVGIFDMICLLAVITISGVSSTRELGVDTNTYATALNRGSYITASIFGCLATFSYVASIFTLMAEFLLIKPIVPNNYINKIIENI